MLLFLAEHIDRYNMFCWNDSLKLNTSFVCAHLCVSNRRPSIIFQSSRSCLEYRLGSAIQSCAHVTRSCCSQSVVAVSFQKRCEVVLAGP
ncbi:unnamed protein product [Caretta caretta]